MLRLIIQTKRKYKKIEKQDIGTNEEIEEVDINEMCSSDDESGGGLSTTTHNDVDSDVSFDEMLMKKSIPHQSKKKTGFSIYREALKKPWKRWKAQRFDAGTGLTKK